MIDQKSSICIIAILLVSLTSCLYIPELQLCASLPFLGHQINKFGPNITDIINSYNISNISGSAGNIKYNLTNINQTININWSQNSLKIMTPYQFNLSINNINLKLNTTLQYKYSLIHQKDLLNITIQNFGLDAFVNFTHPHCVDHGSGIGFSIQIDQIHINTEKIQIKIEGKIVQTAIIKSIIALIKSRLPSMIEKMVFQTLNPTINDLTCKQLNEYFQLGAHHYLAIVNTTDVPHFEMSKKELYAAIDLTFINAETNTTNNEVQNDNLPEQNLFNNQTNVSFLFSSNMMNTIMWLVDDSKVLQLNINNITKNLNVSLPIDLKTDSLSILIPGLLTKYGHNKQVILLVEPASKFNHLYVRNGKIIGALAMSIQFVVVIGNYSYNQSVAKCIQELNCQQAVNLNATIPFSSALRIDKNNTLFGLVPTIAVEQLKNIKSKFDVKTDQLKKIINTMIGSARPQINTMLINGYDISFGKYPIKEVFLKIKQNYGAFGLSLTE